MKKNCLAVSAILCAMTVSTTSASSDLEISNVPGYFKQDLPGTDPGNFDYVFRPPPNYIRSRD